MSRLPDLGRRPTAPAADVIEGVGAPLEVEQRAQMWCALRRTFQDLAQVAAVKDIVTRAVSGHATETMQRHYSTVDPTEIREGLARVIDLAGMREADATPAGEEAPAGAGGMKSGMKGGGNENGR